MALGYAGETIGPISEIPWLFLCVSAALSLVFNYLINFGVAFTYPLFISIGTIVGIPLNTIVDVAFRGTSFSIYDVVGCLTIMGGFCLMLNTGASTNVDDEVDDAARTRSLSEGLLSSPGYSGQLITTVVRIDDDAVHSGDSIEYARQDSKDGPGSTESIL